MFKNVKQTQGFNVQGLYQYMRGRLEEMESITKGQIRITGVFLSETFKQFCLDQKYFSHEEDIFPKHYYFYNMSIKPKMQQFIYNFYKETHNEPAGGEERDILVHISGCSTAVGKTTFLNTLGVALQKCKGLLDEYPMIHDEDYRLKFLLEMNLRLVSVFIYRDVHVSAKAYEDRMRDKQKDRTYKPLTAQEEAERFVNNSIARTQWFYNFVKKRTAIYHEWEPQIYRNIHGDSLAPNLPKKEDYFKPMSLDELGNCLEDMETNRLDHIEKCRAIFAQRIIPEHRMHREIPFPHEPKKSENTEADFGKCATLFYHRTNLQIHNALKKKGYFNENEALRKESFRKAHLDNRKNYVFFAQKNVIEKNQVRNIVLIHD